MSLSKIVLSKGLPPLSLFLSMSLSLTLSLTVYLVLPIPVTHCLSDTNIGRVVKCEADCFGLQEDIDGTETYIWGKMVARERVGPL